MLTPRQHAAPTAIKALSRSAGMHKISYISTKRSGSASRCNIEVGALICPAVRLVMSDLSHLLLGKEDMLPHSRVILHELQFVG